MITITHINYDESQSFQNSTSNVPFIGPAISYSYFSTPDLDPTIETDQKSELSQAIIHSFLNLVNTIEDNISQPILSQPEHTIAKDLIEEKINFEWPSASDSAFPSIHFDFEHLINQTRSKSTGVQTDYVSASGDFIFTII